MAIPNTRPVRCYEGLGEIVRLVERFEAGSLPQADWNHAAHLSVALWYMLHYDEVGATERVIDGIRAYYHANGILQTRHGGYHETITLFWLAIARRYARQLPAETAALDAINGFVDRYGGRPGLFLEYFSKERVGSSRARHFWVEPDLRSLE